MKIFTKIAMTLAVATTVATSAFAGGPMTNTNQSAHFLRSVARGTSLSTDAVYTNPAGVVFMENGFHLGLSNQMAAQTRTITSTYAPFAMGVQNGGQTSKEFKGEVFSPAIPSVHFAWKHNRLAIMAGMGVNGGGGSLEFANGLGSFERMFSVLPVGMQELQIPATAYDMDMYLMGKSMTLAFNAGAAFRITDWLSIAAQVRYSSTSNSYEGHMKDINVLVGGQMQSASALFTSALNTMKGKYEQLVAAGLGDSADAQKLLAGMQAAGENAVKTSNHVLNVKQKGSSISPIVALAFHKGAWDASLKYEFKMATELEIESAEVSAKDPVINSIFADGSKVKAETPALLAAAVSRHFGPVKVTAQWHHYFDKNAKNSFTENQWAKSSVGVSGIYDGYYCTIKGNTNEYMLGVEWQISEKWLVSAGAQRTQLNMNEEFYSDMNYSISSWSIAAGLKYQPCDLVGINLGIMPTLYDEAVAVGKASGVDFKDVYNRTSIAWGIGLDFKFGK